MFSSADSHTFKLPSYMGLHRLDVKDMPTQATVTKTELIQNFTNMATMRRMEIVSD
jgi:hypothetical protein